MNTRRSRPAGDDPDLTLARSLLVDAFGRVHEEVPVVAGGLSGETLCWQPDPQANSIGWLLWHLSRVQDDHLAHLAGACGRPRAQAWAGWRDRFGLPYDPAAIGYGQNAQEVGAFDVSGPELLVGYHRAVHLLTLEVLDELTAADFTRVVDDAWDPPVTAAVRLVSVVNDTTAHVGQAAYLRGLAERRTT